MIDFAEGNLEKIEKQAENGISEHAGISRATSLRRVKEIIDSAISSKNLHFNMKNAKFSVEEIIKNYSEGRPLVNIEGLQEKQLKREDLISIGYDSVGDPEEHEILEKYYPETKNKGINFKIYLFCGEIWSSGIDFIHYTLQEIAEKSNQ